MTSKQKTGGLAGIVVGDSAICLCGAEEETSLYRGYPIQELCQKCSFEEVAWLLMHQDLPSQDELDGFLRDLQHLRLLSSTFKDSLEQLPPTVSLMDALRSAVSILGHLHPENEEKDPYLIAERVFASLPSLLLYWYHFQTTRSRIDLHTGEKSFAGHLLRLISGKIPPEEHIKALNTSLILYAEHEFNASTFTVRTITSTLSDYYSAICGGIGSLRGPLHGGANEAAMELISSFRSPEEVKAAILAKLEKKELIMGFGHRVYTKSDPRSSIIYEEAKKLAVTENDQKLLCIAEAIEEVLWEEKKLFPNLDFYSSLAYHFMGIPNHFFTPLFVMSRVTGWTAHIFEQRKHNKLIRPLSNYIGPNLRHWEPIYARSG